MKNRERGLTYALLLLAAIGILAFLLGTAGAESVNEEDVWWTVLDSISQVGLVIFTAAMVLGMIELTVIEGIVRRTRDEVEEVVDRHHEQLHEMLNRHLSPVIARQSGIVNHFQRAAAMEEMLGRIEAARTQIKLLGICNSIFWDSGYPAPVMETMRERFLNHDCSLEFVYLDREARGLYRARELAESGGDGARLLAETRRSLNCHTLPLYFNVLEELWETEKRRARGRRQDFGRRVQSRMVEGFRILEYCYVPTLSITIIDNAMFVAPYGAGDCKFGPCHEYTQWTWEGDRVTDDWKAFQSHYQEYSDPFRIEAVRYVISPDLVDAMCDDMDRVRSLKKEIVGSDAVEPFEIRAEKEGRYEQLVYRLYGAFQIQRPESRVLTLAASDWLSQTSTM